MGIFEFLFGDIGKELINELANLDEFGIDEFEDGLDDEFENDYWNGAYKELKALKEEIDEKSDKFHVKIEKITKEM